MLGPELLYLFIYWACDPIREKGLSQDEISLSEEIAIVSREISLGHYSSRGGPRIHPRLTNAEDRRGYQSSWVTFQEVP